MNNDSTLSKLVKFLESQPGSRPKSIAEALGISRQYVQKVLANNKNLFTVTGSGPNRFYRNAGAIGSSLSSKSTISSIGNENDRKIERNFYSLTPLGEELVGKQGLLKWSTERGFDPEAKQLEYIAILKKYYPTNFLSPIDFTEKVKKTFRDFSLKKIWAVDYYNFEIFGKTKLGTQVSVAKQTGDPQITRLLIEVLRSVAAPIIKQYKIDAVAFVSPTIQRQAQLMTKLDNSIAPAKPRIKIHKVGARILIAQKTLKSLEDRLLNAAQTFVVESQQQYENILIIDDALGSGATINEIAKQIKQKNIANNCYGLVLISSPSGYEVINEV